MDYDTLLVKYDSSDSDFKEKLDGSVDYLSFTKKEDQISVAKFADEMAQHKMIGDVFPVVFILVTSIMYFLFDKITKKANMEEW